MKRFLTAAVCFVAAVLFSACATPMGTASGQPEITVPTRDADGVKNRFISAMINRGCTVSESTPTMVVFEGKENALGSILAGERVAGRARLNQITLGDQTRFVLSMSLVRQNNFGREVESPFMSGAPDMHKLQQLLEASR